MQERRQYIRVQTPVMIGFPNPETMKTERSYTQNISDTGMRFPTTVSLRVGQQIPLTLELPFSHDATMHATGEIVWVREISRLGAPQYEIGVRFQWVDDPDRKRLGNHLNAFFPGRS